MGLLHDIQADALNEGMGLGPLLLKLRLFAARLGSEPLAAWVKYESDGYPAEAELPDYRVLPVSYTGTFLGAFGSSIQNAQIPPYLVEKFAGEKWVQHRMRQSIAIVDDLLASSAEAGALALGNASNLTLLLQGKIYPDYNCHSVTGTIARSALANVRHAVRSRVLELTIELEKRIPESSAVSIGKSDDSTDRHSARTTQIAQQIIYGNVTSVSASGNAQISIAVGERDIKGLAQFLAEAGFPEGDAKKLSELAASEEPESKSEPMGPKVRSWLIENLKKAANGTWKIGLTVATDVVKEALLKYYGLK